MTNDAKIHDIAVAYILRNVVSPIVSHTMVGALHPSLVDRLSLADGELVLVSAFFSRTSWYAFTTRRIVSRFQGVVQSIDPSHGVVGDFPNFKGYASDGGDKPGAVGREIASIRAANSDAVIRFEFETWHASMAPMYAARYWNIKHPVLHKLMTAAAREKHRTRKPRRNRWGRDRPTPLQAPSGAT